MVWYRRGGVAAAGTGEQTLTDALDNPDGCALYRVR
jgi:hypothetical protein